MTSLRSAVAKTLAYSRHFGLPLTPEKLHHWLISDKPIGPEPIKKYFPVLTSAEKKTITERLRVSQKKHAAALRVAGLLSFFPTIKMICSTGSLAVDNAQDNDDLDFFIVTSANTLWLTRPLVIFLLKALGLRRPTSLPEHRSPVVSDKVCDNLWLDETALALPKNKLNLYTAHEVLQARPLFDRGNTYTKFIRANSWTSGYLANAYAFAKSRLSDSSSEEMTPSLSWGIVQKLNSLAFKLQYQYMKRKITRETITLHSAYFHPNNPSPK